MWIQNTIDYVKEQGLDGVNFDYEGNNPQYTDSYNEIVVDFCEAIHKEIPGSEVSIDVPIYPQYEGRNYDYKRMTDACDTLFIMAYDGEFWDNVQCLSKRGTSCSLACASLEVVEYGIQQYIEAGVSASSLMLGLPWYGLKYEYIAGIPFFTGQMQYKDILTTMDNAGEQGSLDFDDESSTWIFDCGGKCSM
jgi:spore germination protein YaaH